MKKEDKTFEDLIELILDQAERYLQELGEFFPYASVLNKNNELVTLGIYSDEKLFNAKIAIDKIQTEIINKIDKGEIIYGAIGIDGFINATNDNVVLIKVTDNGVDWHQKHFVYSIVDGLVQLDRIIL